MLYLRKSICIFLLTLLLVQPVCAEPATEASTEPTEPDIVTAVHQMALLPGNWSPLSAQTAEKQWLRSLTTAPLYELESDGTWTPVLARALPKDVTEKYAGTYGIPETAQRGYAYRILLHGSACWEDGAPITAGDYLFSIRTLLENEETARNWTFLANAEDILSGKRKPGSGIVSLGDLGFSSVSEAWAAGYREFFVDTEGFWGLSGGWKSISDRIRLQDYAMPGGLDEGFVSPSYLYHNYLISGAESSRFQSRFVGICKQEGELFTMDDLGLIRRSDYELVVILEAPATASSLMHYFDQLFLIRASLFDASYGTGADAYCAYGPYRITAASHKEILLEPNPHWWGEEDPRGYDRILCQKIGS